MGDTERVRDLVEAAAASLEASRERIDDLNVYPVPDGDTGTNMALTVRSVLEGLNGTKEATRPAIAHALTRSALMGARGNSGVILSQIVRGVAEVLGREGEIDGRVVAAALRGASDTAYRGVKRPVEGTMLTVIREMAEEAEARAGSGQAPAAADVLRAALARGEDALARTPELLSVLREAGVVDAGGAGLVELMRGLVAGVTGEEPARPPEAVAIGIETVHRELSRYRYCTAFVVEGDGLDATELERELERLGDSLLVVGDESALKVHVHTDDPGAALSLATARGAIAGVEIGDMHAQTMEREERLSSRPAVAGRASAAAVVAVVAGAGNRALYESVAPVKVVEGGQSMNPATAEILQAIEEADADGVVVLPNNGNVIMSAEQAASMASRGAHVVPTRSIQAGLAALLAYDPDLPAEENAAAMADAASAVVTAAVTRASRDVELDGLRVRQGQYLGLLGDEPFAGGDSFEDVTGRVVDAVLAGEHEVLTLLVGAEAPPLDGVLTALAERHPAVEVEVQDGGQPHYLLLVSAE